MTQEQYLIMVGIRSLEYSYTDEELFEGVEFFKQCHSKGLSAYKALLFFGDYTDGDYEI